MQNPQQDPHAREVARPPQEGDRAPSLGRAVPWQFPSGRPVLVVFLRHCGCPFAEKTFRLLTTLSNHHPEIRCIAVSQSSQADTDKWIVEVGGEWEVEVVVDPERELYAAWGLGEASALAAVSPWTIWRAYKLGTEEGIWNRSVESGNKWQLGGAFAVDRSGFVRWARPAASVNEVPDFEEALKVLKT